MNMLAPISHHVDYLGRIYNIIAFLHADVRYNVRIIGAEKMNENIEVNIDGNDICNGN